MEAWRRQSGGAVKACGGGEGRGSVLAAALRAAVKLHQRSDKTIPAPGTAPRYRRECSGARRSAACVGGRGVEAKGATGAGGRELGLGLQADADSEALDGVAGGRAARWTRQGHSLSRFRSGERRGRWEREGEGGLTGGFARSRDWVGVERSCSVGEEPGGAWGAWSIACNAKSCLISGRVDDLHQRQRRTPSSPEPCCCFGPPCTGRGVCMRLLAVCMPWSA